MAKILQLPVKAPVKLDFERVRGRKKKDSEGHGQLNLFGKKDQTAKIVTMPARAGLFEEALLHDEQGSEKAKKLYLKAIEQEDCVADAYCNLGIIESKAGQITEAYDCFTRSLELDPRHMESHYNLGNLYFEMNNLKLAQQHYEIAAKIMPTFPNIYFNLTLVLALQENLGAALQSLEIYKKLVAPEEADKADEIISNLNKSLAASH